GKLYRNRGADRKRANRKVAAGWPLTGTSKLQDLSLVPQTLEDCHTVRLENADFDEEIVSGPSELVSKDRMLAKRVAA
ncbi:MAG: hypothetical protein NXI32_08490, partial [bacterium]|nr:hypothetical protein [bacterium]